MWNRMESPLRGAGMLGLDELGRLEESGLDEADGRDDSWGDDLWDHLDSVLGDEEGDESDWSWGEAVEEEE